MTLERLTEESLRLYRETRLTRVPITSPSIPILYFGDQVAYEKSAIKVITVGLNPSHREFPVDDRFIRFRKAEQVSRRLAPDKNEMRLVLDSLNEYYKNEPYTRWFACFEPMLEGMNASYYDNGRPNRALHTDICSPLATDITWSKLNDIQRARLSLDGNKLWHSLVEILAPDFILISVARRHLNKIRFNRTKWRELVRITHDKYGDLRNNPYKIDVSTYSTGNNMGILVFGKAANTPFGLISNVQKREIGRILLDLV